jgi:murein DD-endopeptidase MepM/ murein hydrolase activator NlpD
MNMGKHILLTLIMLMLVTFSLSSLFHLQGKEGSAKQEALEPIRDPWITQIVPPGGSISSVLANLDLPGTEIGKISWRIGDYIDVTTIQPGDTLRVLLNDAGDKISKMMFVQEPTVRHHFEARGDSLAYTREALPVHLRERIIDGTLETTLDAALLSLGLSPADKQNINNGLEGEISFQRDARKGDKFRVFIEERIFEGKPLPRAKILYVSYEGVRTGSHELFRYQQDDENSVLNGLYNKDGKSNNTSGVGYPLASIHVSSSFGTRLDPFTGRWANHQGVDYRARYGTPVYAVAAGTVISAHYNGGYGNEVRIKHPSGMMTLYAHLQSFGVRAGQSVKRGHIIGRVGSTGRSTGAHLHFGLHSGGRFINPSNLRMVGAERLNDKQMEEFKRQKEVIRAQMQNALNPQVAKL